MAESIEMEMANDKQLTSDELPIACSLPSEEENMRRRSIADDFRKGIQEVKELEDGYAIRFPATDEWVAQITQFIVVERTCCPFFIFELVFEPNQGPVWLKVRGPEGVKEFLRNGLQPSSSKLLS